MKHQYPRLLSVLCALMIATSASWAVPAYRGWQTRTQPDGTTITIRQVGDEFYHYWETEDGKIAAEQPDGTFIVTDTDLPTAEQVQARRLASKRYVKRALMVGAATKPERALFILVSFSNLSFKATSATYYKSKLGDATEGAMSMYNYLKQQSNGAYAPPVDVFGPVTLSSTYATYGANEANGDDTNPAQMIADACSALDSQIDFSQYDSNSDGVVDNVYVLYAGKGEADGGEANTIWPHQWTLQAAGISLRLDGKYIRSYACSAELNGNGKCAMGTPLHEFGHVIGLPDYYDTEYKSTNYTESRTPGDWSIMDQGSYNNDGNTPPNYSIFDKYYLGWETPKFLAKDEKKNVTMTTDWDDAYQITGGSSRVSATATSPAIVYYIENRQKTGWDAYLPGHGMIIWQVKYNASAWSNNNLNNTGGNPRYTVVSASGTATNIGKASDPFPGSSRVKSYTPVTGCAMTEITESGNNITFKFNGGIDKTKCTYEFLGENCTTPADGEVAINSSLSVTITPSSGYTLNDASCWTVEMGGVELTYGSDFTYNASTNTFSIASLTDDVVIMAEGKRIYTVTWSVNGSTTTADYLDGASLVMPSKPSDCPGGKEFVGWTASTSVTGTKPADLFTTAGTKTVTANVTYYAVYATVSAGGGGSSSTWSLVTDASGLHSGDVLVIASNAQGKTAGDISSSVMSEVASTFSLDKSTITSLAANTIELTLGGSEGAWTLTSSNGILGATAVKKLAWDNGTTTWTISISNGDATIQNSNSTYGRFLHNVTNTRFSTYTSNTSASMLLPQLYRKGGGVSYSDYTTNCVVCALTSISLNTTGVTTTFTTDDSFSEEGLVVTANYSNCSSKTVTPTSISTPDMATAGSKTITVTYTENDVSKTATYSITVTELLKHTVTWVACSTTFKTEQYVDGDPLVLPSPAPGSNTEDKAFYGWITDEHYSGADAPTKITAGGAVTADATYYAVYY